MGLLDLKTDLKSLKFGNPPASDRPGSGNSGQPYITDPISSDIIPQSDDFLLKGGLNTPLDAANDVVRLTKFFGDLKSPRGILFVAKQNLLSRIGAATQASGDQSDSNSWKDSSLNEGTYTPLSTIAQAGVGFTGEHLYKQGLNPLKGVNTYIDSKTLVIGESDGKNNRLVDLYNTQIPNYINNFSIEDPVNIYSYSGGPGSNKGLGETNIKFATDNKGGPLLSGVATKDYQAGIGKSGTDRSVLPPFYSPLTNNGVTNIFENSFPNSVNLKTGLNDGNNGGFGREFPTSVYKSGSLKNTERANDNGALTFSQNQIISIGVEGNSNNPFQDSGWAKNTNEGYNPPKTLDFRAPLIEGKKSSTIMSFSPSYKPNEGKTKAIDGVDGSRISMTSPGQKGNVIDYTKGKIIGGNYDGTGGRVSVVDHINFQPIYKSSDVRGDLETGDLVQFRIGAILRSNGNSTPEKVYMHFRAFIDKFSDSYDAKWSGTQYMGRGEEFYKYGGFSRKISLSYTIAAQSKPELMAQYKKLNFLASTLSPDYGGEGGSGYMGGVLTTLTLGGWCYELPGFISSLSLDIPKESPWEIAIDTEGEKDPTVKEMPHICNVTMNFTPIHTFRPELQKNTWKGEEIDTYGDQHYIGLKNKTNNNYVPVSLKEAETPGSTQFQANSTPEE